MPSLVDATRPSLLKPSAAITKRTCAPSKLDILSSRIHINPRISQTPNNFLRRISRSSRTPSSPQLLTQPLPLPPKTNTLSRPSLQPNSPMSSTMAPASPYAHRFVDPSRTPSLSNRNARRETLKKAQATKRLRGSTHIASSSITSLTELAATSANMNMAVTTDPATIRMHCRHASESAFPNNQLVKPPLVEQQLKPVPAPLRTKKRLLALNHFRLNKTLGSGGTATVFRAEVVSSSPAAKCFAAKEVALKAIPKKGLTRRAQHYLTREIAIHRNVQDHPNITSIHEVFEDSAGIYISMELLRGSDLYTALKRERRGFSELISLSIVAQVLEALRYIHSKGYAHRDIKPENIVFTEKPFLADGKLASIKLIDFGLASARNPNATEREKLSSEKCGTVRYAAPEIVTQTAYVPELCDMWSVGIVLYSAIAHRNPYTGKTEKEVLYQISNTPLSFNSPEWERISEETKQLIRSCLAIKPSARPSAARALKEAYRIIDMVTAAQASASKRGYSSDERLAKRREKHELNRSDMSAFSSHVTPEANGNSGRRRDSGDGNDSRCPSNGGESNGQTPNFLDGLLAWFSGGSSPEKSGLDSSH